MPKINMPKIENKLLVKNESNKEKAEMYLYGVIRKKSFWDNEDSEFISANKVKSMLDELNNKNVNIHINSNGGDVFESISICNMLKKYEGEVNIIVDAMAASGASIILTGADKIFMYANSMQMIHKAWTICSGNADQLMKQAKDMEKIDESVEASYMNNFVGEKEELEKLISDETFLTAEECLTFGFCDVILDDEEDNHDDQSDDLKENLLNKYKSVSVSNKHDDDVVNLLKKFRG